MASVSHRAVDEAMVDVTSGIPGPQEGESVFDYRARVNGRLMEVVAAAADHKKRVDTYIRDHADPKLEPTEQFYNAVRRRFIPDEFEE